MNYKRSKYFTTLSKKKIKYLYIKRNSQITVVFFHGFMSDMIGAKPSAIQKFCKKQKLNFNKITHDDKLAKVSIIGAGMQANPGVTHKMFRSLADEKINILAISTSEIKISVLIREDLNQKAVKTLHKTFGLN